MPRVYLTKQEQMNNRLVAMIYGTMKVKRISQKKMADEMGISQPAFGKKLKKAQFTFADLVTVFKVLETPDNEILSVFRER